MLQRHLQYRYITRWLATNGKVKEGVLSEGSHSSAGYGSMALRSAVSFMCYPDGGHRIYISYQDPVLQVS
jgi:hypothetical protein